MKFKVWEGQDLEGHWTVSYKLDGVRAKMEDGKWLSRAGKELYNLPYADPGIYEVYTGSFKDTVSKVKTHALGNAIAKEDLYQLDPVDSRLWVASLIDPKAPEIKEIFTQAIEKGYEGLVLRQGDVYLKVKTKETYDVSVLAMGEGKGKHKGRLGYFLTPMGKVGTGFTDEEREHYWKGGFVGTGIEVECMSLTEDGKFRHPRFIRERFDKECLSEPFK